MLIRTPDLRGRFVQGAGTVLLNHITDRDQVPDGGLIDEVIDEAIVTRELGNYELNASGGRPKRILGPNNIPSHSHTYDRGHVGHRQVSPVISQDCGSSNFSNLHSDNTGNAGNSSPFYTIPPFCIYEYIIKQPLKPA